MPIDNRTAQGRLPQQIVSCAETSAWFPISSSKLIGEFIVLQQDSYVNNAAGTQEPYFLKVSFLQQPSSLPYVEEET